MEHTENDEKDIRSIAEFRFGLVAPVIQNTFPDESIAAYCRRITEKPFVLPGGRTCRYRAKTIEKWIGQYRKNVIEALTPKRRADLGATRVITPEAEDEIYRLKKEYPRLNAVQIRDRLIKEGILPETVSPSTIQRYIKRHGLKGAAQIGRASCRERV